MIIGFDEVEDLTEPGIEGKREATVSSCQQVAQDSLGLNGTPHCLMAACFSSRAAIAPSNSSAVEGHQIVICSQIHALAKLTPCSLGDKMKGIIAVTGSWRTWLRHRNHRVRHHNVANHQIRQLLLCPDADKAIFRTDGIEPFRLQAF